MSSTSAQYVCCVNWQQKPHCVSGGEPCLIRIYHVCCCFMSYQCFCEGAGEIEKRGNIEKYQAEWVNTATCHPEIDELWKEKKQHWVLSIFKPVVEKQCSAVMMPQCYQQPHYGSWFTWVPVRRRLSSLMSGFGDSCCRSPNMCVKLRGSSEYTGFGYVIV